jgi:hypothetical protein
MMDLAQEFLSEGVIPLFCRSQNFANTSRRDGPARALP